MEKPKCEKCNKENVSHRFLGKDICLVCYDKINNLIKPIIKL